MIRLLTTILLLVLASVTQAIQPDPVYRETEVRNDRPRAAGEIFDPQEANSELRDIFSAVDKLAERRVGNVKRNADFIHRFWHEKKAILRDKYDIQWLSPADLNPSKLRRFLSVAGRLRSLTLLRSGLHYTRKQASQAQTTKPLLRAVSARRWLCLFPKRRSARSAKEV